MINLKPNSTSDQYWQRRLLRFELVVVALFVFMLAWGCTSSSDSSATTEPAAPEAAEFPSPDAAVQALISALRANDHDQLHNIFGTEGDKIISSGDPVADQQGINRFVQSYDEKHELQINKDGSVTLVVGNKDWPCPIPIVKDDQTGNWYLDADAGEEEILNRRIGRNELDVIQVCQAIADAQQEYATRDPQGAGVPEYAQKFVSDPGKKNGLYWPTSDSEQPSPLGPLVASAVKEGYTTEKTGPKPYHGYYFRMLKAQGPSAPGGAEDYLVDGKLIGGFAVLAYPAEYGNSGVMTFMMDHNGVVYQKDLGPSTDKTAPSITAFDPGPGWQKVPEKDTSEQ